MSVRYIAGYGVVWLSRFLARGLSVMLRLAWLPQEFAMVVWTSREIDRYSRGYWNSRELAREYTRSDDWLDEREKGLVEKHLAKHGELLNLACGAGREAMLLARRGLRVTACDWSPRMIEAARDRAEEANLPIRFEVADLYDLRYPENAFDYLLLTNISYSYFFPRQRRVRFLRRLHSFLKPGGVFIVSFARGVDGSSGLRGLLQSLCLRLRRYAPFNRDYEPGDSMWGTFIHFFEPDALEQEFKEAQFSIQEWLWDNGYAVLTRT